MQPSSPPAFDGPIHQGDVFWLAADPERGSIPGVPHPHVVVQSDVLNQSRLTSVVVCALSTNMKCAREPGNVLLEAGEANLPRRSIVVVSAVSAVEKTQLGAWIGRLEAERMEQIFAGMQLLQRTYFAR